MLQFFYCTIGCGCLVARILHCGHNNAGLDLGRGMGVLFCIVTCYERDSLRSNPGGGKIFSTYPDWCWGPPSLLYNGYWVSFLGVKQPRLGVEQQPPSTAKVKGRVKLYFYSPSVPSWPVLG